MVKITHRFKLTRFKNVCKLWFTLALSYRAVLIVASCMTVRFEYDNLLRWSYGRQRSTWSTSHSSWVPVSVWLISMRKDLKKPVKTWGGQNVKTQICVALQTGHRVNLGKSGTVLSDIFDTFIFCFFVSWMFYLCGWCGQIRCRTTAPGDRNSAEETGGSWNWWSGRSQTCGASEAICGQTQEGRLQTVQLLTVTYFDVIKTHAMCVLRRKNIQRCTLIIWAVNMSY